MNTRHQKRTIIRAGLDAINAQLDARGNAPAPILDLLTSAERNVHNDLAKKAGAEDGDWWELSRLDYSDKKVLRALLRKATGELVPTNVRSNSSDYRDSVILRAINT